MATFNLKNRDTRPVLEVALLDPDGSAHDLTGATGVTLHVKIASGTTLSRAMVIDATPTTGLVTYTWAAADWTGSPGLEPGTHRMEYEVTGPALARLTFPNDSYDTLAIVSDQGQA